MNKKVEEKGKGKLNRFPQSLLRIKDNLILHRLVNDKKGKSFTRLENYKFSTTIENSVKNTINLNLSFLKDSKLSNKDELLSLNKKALEEINKL
jgi:hypothetical protein